MEIANANPKYAVLKWHEWLEIEEVVQVALGKRIADDMGKPINDAVVIRRQDVFAPPALDAYANSMRIVLEGMDPGDMRRSNLQKVADYFAGEAAEAWLNHDRKLPD